MPKFSDSSQNKLNTCHPELRRLFEEVIKHFDCTIICGSRSDSDQKKAFEQGVSRIDGVMVKSKHQVDSKNQFSRAVDVMPYPIDWNDHNRIRFFAGFVMGIAASLNISIRWGGDWDSDTDLKNNKFNDFPHFELK